MIQIDGLHMHDNLLMIGGVDAEGNKQSCRRPPYPGQVWEIGDADKAEHFLRNLARRPELEMPGVSTCILEGLDEILTVLCLGVPPELRRALASTNIIESIDAVSQGLPERAPRAATTGTFGTQTVRVPRAQIENEAGKGSEWRSKALPRYRRLTKKAKR